MAKTVDGNGWDEYQRLVLSQLTEHGHALREIREQQTEIRVEMGSLKTKAGLASGFVAVFITCLANLLWRRG